MAYAITQLMNTRCLSAILAAIFLAAGLPSVANAAFYDSTDFLIAGQSPRFDNSSLQLYGYVDYAVYAPGDFTGASALEDKYYYCYQIFDSSTSAPISKFTFDLDSGVTAYSPGSFVFSAGDITPNAESFNAPIVTYFFNTRGNNITANHNSSVLFFAADSGPVIDIDSGTITGASGTTVSLPAPTPEPASILLLTLATPFLLKTRRRKS